MKKLIFVACAMAMVLVCCKTEDVEPKSKPENVVLTSSANNIYEDAGEVVLTASVGKLAEQDIKVNLSYKGSATISDDYTAASSIIIPQGSLSGAITLSTVQDTIEEGNESIVIAIESVENGLEEGEQSISLVLEDDDVAFQLNMIFNEILYDPSNNALDGDANGDGSYAQNEDEFIEFVNLSSQSVNLEGYKIFDTENAALNVPNHTFPAGSIVESGKAIVVFGGGSPTGTFGNAKVQVSSSGDLNMNNAGDEIMLVSPAGDTLLRFNIEPLSNNPNESYTRNPDISGEFEQHGANTLLLFSPGTKINGDSF